MNPQFPIYIPSKGRWEQRITVRTFDRMGVPYRVVVEEQEFEKYAAVIDPQRLLILDKAYQRDYDTCDKLGDSIGKGSGPARNFIWEHSVREGHAAHWIVDDNIYYFARLNNNMKVKVGNGAIFCAMEDFCARYVNIALAGPNYESFVHHTDVRNWSIMNTRVFSCILIRNDIPYRWRGRYNEDADLSIRVLKDRWCTLQFNAFLQRKAETQTVRGGNTSTIYQKGTLLKSVMLYQLHPDVTKLKWRFGRPHHIVDFRDFQKRNKLIRKPGLMISDEPNEYGMRFRRLDVPGKPQKKRRAEARLETDPFGKDQATSR